MIKHGKIKIYSNCCRIFFNDIDDYYIEQKFNSINWNICSYVKDSVVVSPNLKMILHYLFKNEKDAIDTLYNMYPFLKKYYSDKNLGFNIDEAITNFSQLNQKFQQELIIDFMLTN